MIITSSGLKIRLFTSTTRLPFAVLCRAFALTQIATGSSDVCQSFMKPPRMNTDRSGFYPSNQRLNISPIRKFRMKRARHICLDIGYADGLKPVLALPEAEVPNGTRVG